MSLSIGYRRISRHQKRLTTLPLLSQTCFSEQRPVCMWQSSSICSLNSFALQRCRRRASEGYQPLSLLRSSMSVEHRLRSDNPNVRVACQDQNLQTRSSLWMLGSTVRCLSSLKTGLGGQHPGAEVLIMHSCTRLHRHSTAVSLSLSTFPPLSTPLTSSRLPSQTLHQLLASTVTGSLLSCTCTNQGGLACSVA